MANPFAAAATAGFPAAAPTANPFGVPAATAPAQFGAAPAAANPFGAPAATAAQTAAPAASSSAMPIATPGLGAADPVAKRVRAFGGFAWFQDLPRPPTAQPVATAYGQPPPPPVRTNRPPYDIERRYAKLRVAYSNRAQRDIDIERQALAAPAAVSFGGFGAAPAAQPSGTGDGTRLKPEFVKPVWVLADPKQRVYAPPALKELDPSGNEVILPSTRQPKIVELLRVEEVRPTRTRPDGSRILDDSALIPLSDRTRGMAGYESGPRFVQSVAIGFSGLKVYTSELQRAAVSLKEAAITRMGMIQKIRDDLSRAVTQVERLDERQRRLSKRCVDAAQMVAEVYNPSDTASLTRDERQVISRVSEIQQRVTAPHGLHRRTAAVQTQAALVSSHGSSSGGTGASALQDADALNCIVSALTSHQDSIDKLKEQVSKATSHLQIIANGVQDRG